MKMKLYFLYVATLCFFLSSFLYAENGDEKEIEDLYLQNPELMWMEKQAYSDNRYTQMEALNSIELYLDNMRSENKSGDNKISKEEGPREPIDINAIPPQLEDFLIYLGSQGSLMKKYSGRIMVNNFPEIRRKACKLLGWIRTRRSKKALIDFLTNDSAPDVQAEAAWALGEYAKYEGDEGGEIVRAMGWIIENDKSITPDDNLAYAIILSLEKIANKHDGHLTNSAGYTALIKIAQGNYIKTVRTKALEVIHSMSQK